MKESTLRGKLTLIVFGIFLAILLLEIGLRAGGFLFLSAQEHRNKASLTKQSDYRILCLGESTTALGGADSYPRQLEKILNSSGMEKSFTVINKGIPAMTTTDILSNLDNNIKEFRPRIIIAMMGINDLQDPFNKEGKAASNKNPLFENLRVYKLAKLLWLHLTIPPPEKEKDQSQFKTMLKNIEIKLKQSPSSKGYMQLGILYWGIRQGPKAKEAFLKANALDPDDNEILGHLALQHKRLGEYAEAIPLFQKVLQRKDIPKGYKMKMENYLADSYKIVGKFDQAAQIYKKQIATVTRHPTAYSELGRIYVRKNQYDMAEKLFNTQIQINPHSVESYTALAHLYRKKGHLPAAEAVLAKALQVNPTESILYAELGSELFKNKKYSAAEKIFSKALTLKPGNSLLVDFNSFYTYLLACYEAQGKYDQAEELKKTSLYGPENYSPQTHKNYQMLKKISTQKNIRLIVVQYPLRDIEPLEKMLAPAGITIFVNNKEIFEEGIAKSNYDDYFTDRFAVDFGHCTAKGNRLLAENIARVMMRELFSQNDSPPPIYARQ